MWHHRLRCQSLVSLLQVTFVDTMEIAVSGFLASATRVSVGLKTLSFCCLSLFFLDRVTAQKRNTFINAGARSQGAHCCWCWCMANNFHADS